MKPSLQLRMGQSLTMTPQLQQAIKLLQLSSLELQTEVREALESNMMLELDEDEEAATPQQLSDNQTSETHEQTGDKTEAEAEFANDDIPEDLPVDSAWDDIYDAGSYTSSSGNTDMDMSGYENQSSRSQTLQEYLHWQLNLTPTTETDRAIATAIIDSLDDDGYLTVTPEDILESLDNGAALGDDIEIGLDEVVMVLHIIQAMDPPGVGATDLRNCLLLQLQQLPADTPWLKEAQQLVDKHLASLGNRDYSLLLRQLRLDRDDLQQVLNLIQSLNPRPGGQVQDMQPEYITPDVYVKKDKGVWRVELNSDAIPQLRINANYASMVKRADNSNDNNSLKSHLQEARWFIKSLQSRSETLLRVATAIVERQRAFLEQGDEAMKPLVLHDIAEALGMHESTISRVTTRKYMHTPRGIFELKYFFSSHVSTSIGGTCSSTAIRAQIKKLISEEPPQKPLSDSKLATILSERGIEVARRTVAKYREAMAIPPSNERKHL
ncbi:MAG: RNA polymerase factor sigma-54 [Gammaproteobacteria bacterium]